MHLLTFEQVNASSGVSEVGGQRIWPHHATVTSGCKTRKSVVVVVIVVGFCRFEEEYRRLEGQLPLGFLLAFSS